MKFQVREYLLREHGIKPDRVDALLELGADFIDTAERLGSRPYYPAGQIVDKFANDADFDPNFVPPTENEDDGDDDLYT